MSPPPSGPPPSPEEEMLTRWFATITRARKSADWLRAGAWVFGIFAILSLIGSVATLLAGSVGFVGAITSTFLTAMAAAILSAGGVLLEVHAARLELAIVESSIAEDDD